VPGPGGGAHAADRKERRVVARAAQAIGGQGDDRQELDRRDRRQRQPVDRQVEAGDHRRQHLAPRQQQPAPIGVEPCEQAPWPPPRAKIAAELTIRSHVAPSASTRQQQHGEGGSELLEDGADEVRVRRDPGRGTRWNAPRTCNPHTGDQPRFSQDDYAPRSRRIRAFETPELDAIDRLILPDQAEARISNGVLGRRVGLFAPPSASA
jgi:hypothetical protein